MVSRHKVMLADWYSRVVFGVIAVALVTLAGQGACSVEPVALAQGVQCGSMDNPCYVQFPKEFQEAENGLTTPTALRVCVVNPVRTADN